MTEPTRPPFPKLNLGCRSDILEGWVNIDLYPIDERVEPGDIRALRFEPDSVAAIRAIDVLEHIPRAETQSTLNDWYRLLMPQGTLEIRCPDVKKQCVCLLDGTWSPQVWAHMVFGGQDTPGNFHQSGFTQESLTELIFAAGFTQIKAVPEYEEIPHNGNANFRLTAVKT